MTSKSMRYFLSAFILFFIKRMKGIKEENKNITVSDIANYCETPIVYHAMVVATVTKRNESMFSTITSEWQADDWLAHIVGIGSKLMFNINEPDLLFKPSKETIKKIAYQFQLIGIDVKEVHLRYGNCIIIHHVI